MRNSLLLVLLFILACGVGFWIATQKPLWNDEIYTLVSSIQRQSFSSMLSGHIPEGNNSPAFYALQKVLICISQYQVPLAWINGDWGVRDAWSQIVLRINPIIFMSLSIVLVFSFFLRQYSLWAGILSVFIYVSSYMLWIFWAESRPYAMLVWLTTVQALLLIRWGKIPEQRAMLFKWICIVHVALALTSVLSAGQIIAASSVIFMMEQKQWRRQLGLTVLPLIIIFFYYTQAPHYNFYFDLTAEQLIRDNISRERLYVIMAFVLILGLCWFRKIQQFTVIMPYLIFFIVCVGMTGLYLAKFIIQASPNGQGFAINSRYFIYLMPLGVLASTWMMVLLWRSLKTWTWAQLGFALAMAGLFVPKFIKIVPRAIQSILGGSG